jgi:hypothetical protein
MTVLLQGANEVGQDRFEALAADPVRGFLQDDEGFAHHLIVDPPSNGGSLHGGANGTAKQADGVFAVTASDSDKLV